MHVCVPRHMCGGIGQLEEVCSVFPSCRFWDSAHNAHCQAYQPALLYNEFLSWPKCCSWPLSSIVTSSIWLSDLLSLESSSAHFPATGHHWRSPTLLSCITNWLLSYTLVLWTFWIVYMCACSDRGGFKQIPSKSTLLWRTCYQTSKMTLGRHVLMQDFFLW